MKLSPFKVYLSLKGSTPTFIFEKRILEERVNIFKKVLKKLKTKISPFFAVKSNSYFPLLCTLTKKGINLEVASLREMKLAKEARTKEIIFNGRGKRKLEVDFALKNFEKVYINLDSFQELELVKNKKKAIVGVRVFTKHLKLWRDFGIPLEKLKDFVFRAKLMGVEISGIHFHSSWNKSAKTYIKNLFEIEKYLRNKNLLNLKYIDIGGGLETEEEGGEKMDDFLKKVDTFCQKKFPRIRILCEFGRWFSSHCFHILLKVIDQKEKNVFVLDGGTDNFGFSQKNCFSIPINLSHFSNKKIKVKLLGSLCSIHDIWGKEIFAKKIKIGDLILFPFQGAYTFNLATDFIREKGKVIDI